MLTAYQSQIYKLMREMESGKAFPPDVINKVFSLCDELKEKSDALREYAEKVERSLEEDSITDKEVMKSLETALCVSLSS